MPSEWVSVCRRHFKQFLGTSNRAIVPLFPPTLNGPYFCQFVKTTSYHGHGEYRHSRRTQNFENFNLFLLKWAGPFTPNELRGNQLSSVSVRIFNSSAQFQWSQVIVVWVLLCCHQRLAWSLSKTCRRLHIIQNECIPVGYFLSPRSSRLATWTRRKKK